jgi:hypothetical protein
MIEVRGREPQLRLVQISFFARVILECGALAPLESGLARPHSKILATCGSLVLLWQLW